MSQSHPPQMRDIEGLLEAADQEPADAAMSEVPSPARRELLALSAAACGAALLLGSAPVRAASYDESTVLRFLEEVELLQSDFFARVSASTAYDGMENRERDVFNTIAQQDREHADWFRLARKQYGISEFGRLYTPNSSSSRPPRNFTFPLEVFSTRAKLFPFAVSLKETAVGAYHAVVGRTSDTRLIEAVAALAGIEGRHAAALRETSGVNPLPSAFETPISSTEVKRRLAIYKFRGEEVQ